MAGYFPGQPKVLCCYFDGISLAAGGGIQVGDPGLKAVLMKQVLGFFVILIPAENMLCSVIFMGSSNWSMAELIFDSVTLKSLLNMVSSLLLLCIPSACC